VAHTPVKNGELHTQFLSGQRLASTLIIVFSYLAVRWINNRYERLLEGKKNDLADEVTALNANLIVY
jgi:hypothetical protein